MLHIIHKHHKSLYMDGNHKYLACLLTFREHCHLGNTFSSIILIETKFIIGDKQYIWKVLVMFHISLHHTIAII